MANGKREERDRSEVLYLIVSGGSIGVESPNLHDRRPGRFLFQNGARKQFGKSRNHVVNVIEVDHNLRFSCQVVFILNPNGQRVFADAFII